jgi:hypothetical protein
LWDGIQSGVVYLTIIILTIIIIIIIIIVIAVIININHVQVALPDFRPVQLVPAGTPRGTHRVHTGGTHVFPHGPLFDGAVDHDAWLPLVNAAAVVHTGLQHRHGVVGGRMKCDKGEPGAGWCSCTGIVYMRAETVGIETARFAKIKLGLEIV